MTRVEGPKAPAALRRRGVAMLCQRYHPLFGGAAVQARRLTAELRRRGWPVWVIAARTRGLARKERIDDTPVLRVRTFGGARLFNLLFWVGCLVPLALRLRAWSILHVHGVHPFAWFSSKLAHAFGKRVVVKMTLMGADDASEIDAGRFGWMNRSVLEQADAVVSISAPMSDAYRESGLDAARLHEMPQGVDLELYRPATREERDALRRKLGLPEAGRLLVCVGAVFRRKGTDLVVRAFARLAAERPDLALVLVGMDDTTVHPEDMPEEREFSLGLKRELAGQGLSDRVFFTGVVDNVQDWMRAADLFVFASRREGFGTVMVEAMACGLPSVVAPIHGIAATVYSHGNDGVIVEGEDPVRWAVEIAGLLDDPERAGRMGRAARAVAEERYGFAVVCERYEALYASLL